MDLMMQSSNSFFEDEDSNISETITSQNDTVSHKDKSSKNKNDAQSSHLNGKNKLEESTGNRFKQ